MDFPEAEKEPRCFKKLESRSTGRGLKYEHNMCSLVFARTTKLKYNFSLASNMDDCGAFDDVVLQFNKHDNKERCFFVQMKSKANTTVGFSSLLSTKPDFRLLKYFESYLEIKKNFKIKDDTPFDGKFDDILFVLYTNSDVTPELKTMLSESREDDMIRDARDILLTNEENEGAVLQLKLDGKIYESLLKDLNEKKSKDKDKNTQKGRKASEKSEKVDNSVNEEKKIARESESIEKSEKNVCKENESVEEATENTCKENKNVDEEELKEQVKEFLEKVVIMYKQTEEECFGDVVKAELRNHLELSDQEMLVAQKKYEQLFEEWWQKDYFLDPWIKNNPITEVFKHVKSEHASQLLKHRKMEINNLNIKFVDSAFNNIREIIGKNQVIVVSPRYTVDPTLAKINQLLPQIANHAILKLNYLVKEVECIAIAWERGLFEILVVDVCEVQDGLDSALSRIQQIIKSDKRKKVIFVSAYGRNMNYMKTIRTTFRNLPKTIQDTQRYPELSEETKESFLNKKVVFQEDTLLLSQLVSSTDLTVLNELDDESVSLLLSNEILKIGSKLEDSLDYYIDRKLEISRTVSENILQESGAVLAVDNKTSEKFCLSASSLSNFVLIENSSDFEEMKGNVHWLITDEDRLVWKQSKGNLDIIRRHLIPHSVMEREPMTVLSEDDRIMLLTAEPGMGKSSLLSHLAKMTKKTHPGMWVIRININNFTKILEDIKNEGFNEEKAKEMLEIAAGLKDTKGKSLETSLFEKAYIDEGNIAILIDGIDEVSPSYTEEAIKIVRFFCDTEVVKIWVTSRVFMKNMLEEEFGIPSYSLVPFDKQEQELFLVKFWMSVHPGKDEEVLKRLASNIRRLVASQFKDHESDFMGIPIQSLLLAEISSSFDNPTIKNINLYTLYELYVKRKWDIYLTEKMNADTTNVMVNHDTSSLYKKFIENHKAAAVIAFLKADDLKEINCSNLINQENAFMQNVRNGIEKTGIIQSVNNAGHAVFIHRTFCEYFVALWVFDNFMSSRKPEMFLNSDINLGNVQVVLKRIFDDGFKVVKTILERMLAKDLDIHTSILNDNDVDFKKAFETCNLNELDHGGRTPLHVASSCGNNKFVRILLDHGADACKKDTLLGISSLTYAIRAEHWNAIADILDKRPESRELELEEKKLGNIHFMTPILRCAKENDNVDLLQYLTQQKGWILLNAGVHVGNIEFTELVLSVGTSVNVPSPEGRTALHITCENNDFSLGRLLMMKGASVNSADNSGVTPLHVAVEKSSHALIQLLLHNRADINSKTNNGFTPLHIASRSGNLESANILLNQGADANSVDNNGNTPLHLAAQHGHQVSQLLKYGAAIDIPSGDGSYPLHTASRYGHSNVVEVLLNQGVAVNVVDKNGKSPLHVACEQGYVEVVRLLINKGALVNVRDNSDCTPLMLAKRNGHDGVRDLLLSSGAAEEQVTIVEEVKNEEEENDQSKIERETARIARQVHDEGQRFFKRVRKLF